MTPIFNDVVFLTLRGRLETHLRKLTRSCKTPDLPHREDNLLDLLRLLHQQRSRFVVRHP